MPQTISRWTLTIVFSLLLMSCSSSYKSFENDGSKELRAKLYQIETFQFNGKLGFRNSEEAFSVAINNWLQDADKYQIELSSTFFGLGAIELKGTAAWIEANEPGQEPVRSDYPNYTIKELLGSPLPIQRIRYWLRGIPAPQSKSQETLNEQGLLSTLEQDGWTIHLDRYHDVSNLPLPGRIKIEQNDTRITLVVAQWSIL